MMNNDVFFNVLFVANQQPEVVDLNPSAYIVADTKILAETPEAFLAIKALYSLSELIKDLSKNLSGYYNYEIYPLEGVWSLINEEEGFLEHTNIIGNFMLKQPEFLTEKLFNQCKDQLLIESQEQDFYEYLQETNYKIMDEGKNIKMLHIGPYSEEQRSFDLMEKFAAESNLRRKYNFHRESYIKDIRTVTPDKFETILKFQVE